VVRLHLQPALHNDYKIFYRKMYHISELIGRIFFQNKLCSYFYFGSDSLIHSALQRNAATILKVFGLFSFSHVIDSCSFFLFLLFSIFHDFSIRIIVLLGLAVYQIIVTNSALRTSPVIYHLIPSENIFRFTCIYSRVRLTPIPVQASQLSKLRTWPGK